ncbi:WD40/YVTN/BNR-like repeat-containing protein [Mucilaginibacter flavidus]|uniref:WD40/YVTN/BNR-like repeat-containing protein n=1 Tax=Mucilaginibacter flavidus TaxID=2949309 RepID=UPI002091FCA0|nr:YCF48-related protein [Mucilaginibacter flavidus]MCO5945732.1 YCF48-related protein [Mucilaginibacter flavidus]
MKKLRLLTTCLLAFLIFATTLKAQTIVQLQTGKSTSIRGLSVVDDNVAWISGSRGYIAITRDGGKNWDWTQVKGFEKADFRDIEAFSDKTAVIMSSGTPALVLKTTDGGATWQEKYRNTDTTYFLDAMDFDTPKHGLILGDPIKNKFLLLETNDGGETWAPFKNMPDALPGEAAFAASGTCLRFTNGNILIASGGSNSRLISYSQKKEIWDYSNFPITHGKSSEGAFSVAVGKNNGIMIGGNYEKDKITDSVSVSYIPQPFKLLNAAVKQPAGFQSCVEYITGNIFLATGTPGSNITIDGGKTWKQIDSTSYNVCRKAKHGKLVLLAGNGGKIGILKM